MEEFPWCLMWRCQASGRHNKPTFQLKTVIVGGRVTLGAIKTPKCVARNGSGWGVADTPLTELAAEATK